MRFRLLLMLLVAGGTLQKAEAEYCDVVVSACDAIPSCDRLSGRAFLFDWHGASDRDMRLNLSEPLLTDRPDFTEASSTVGLNVTQLEFGYTYTSSDQTDVHTYPEVLLRQGILRDWLELRVAYTAASVSESGMDTTGSGDLYLGFKIGLTPQIGWAPEMALMPQMTVPSGSDEFTNDEVLPGLNWLYGWDLSDCLSFAGSTQFNRSIDSVSADEYTQWAQSLTFGYSLAETWGAYTEWFAFFPDGADTDPVEQYFNGGFTKQFGINAQWDVRAGLGLNDDSDDFFVGTGLSLRFL